MLRHLLSLLLDVGGRQTHRLAPRRMFVTPGGGIAATVQALPRALQRATARALQRATARAMTARAGMRGRGARRGLVG
ncbi:hypothetical protein BL254_08320 [Protofrankia sp. BMG5.30]|nr:hypothetical protein BL254_08320 [Protofrankia sp. BMG5.30]